MFQPSTSPTAPRSRAGNADRPALRAFMLVLFGAAVVFSTTPALATDEEHAHEHEHGRDHEPPERIVVTASPLDHRAEELALPVAQLDRDQILEQLGTTVGDTLRNVPGVANTGFSAGVSRPVIRGQDAFRTEVLESGLSTQDASRLSPDHAVPVNPLAAQYIEVVRGPGVLRYGGGASAGVVNVVTDRVPRRTVDAPLTGEVTGVFGQNAEERDLATKLGGDLETPNIEGDVVWHFDGLLRKAEDYETGSKGDQPGTGYDSFSASGGASWIHDEGRVGVAYTRYENEYGIPEEGEPVLIDMKTDRVRLEADLAEPVGKLREVNFRGVYSDYSHDEIADGEVGQTYRNREFDGRVEALHDEAFGFLGAIGLHARYQDLEAGAEAAEFLAPTETSSFAFYVFEETSLTDHLDLEAAFRAEGVWVDGESGGDDESRSFAPLSGSLALVAHPYEGWTFGLTGIVGQRAPSQVELFAMGPHEATATFELGDDDLDEETSFHGELRAERSVGRIRAESAVFVTRYNDYIFGELTGRTVDEDGDPAGDELEELVYTSRDALFWGAEVQLGADLFEVGDGMIETEWQFDYVRARFQDGSGNKNVPRITPIRWGGKLAYRQDRLNGYFGFLRTEKQRNGASNEFETKSYTMLELGMRYRPASLEDLVPIEIGMTARNLLDENARNPVAFNKDEVRLPGRSFLFSVHARF